MKKISDNYGSAEAFLILRFVYIAVMTIFQIAIPILLIRNLGSSNYGIWVFALSAVSFLGFIDFGFFNSVVNEVIALRTAKKSSQGQEKLESMSKFVIVVALIFFAIIIMLRFIGIGKSQNGNLILWLAVAAIIQIIIRMNEAISRANLSADGFMILVVSYISESCCVVIGVINNLNLANLAIMLVMPRIFYSILGLYFNRARVSLFCVLRVNTCEYLTFGRNNLKKGILFLAVPLGNLILFDGSNIILGIFVSKQFVAELSILRISTGVIRQFSSAVLASYSPAVSHAIFSRDQDNLDKLRKRMRVILVLGITFLSIGILISMQFLFEHFFVKISLISIPVFLIFLFSVLLDVPWNFRATFLFAVNEHAEIAKKFIISSVIALIVIYPLVANLGLIGVAVSFSIQDFMLTRFAFRTSAKIIYSKKEEIQGINCE